MENYTEGLMLPIDRKSVEPMAARLAPGNVRQMHQSLHHIVAAAAWSDDEANPQASTASHDADAETRPGRLDRGRHGVPQERNSFGRSCPPVLRVVGQAGQLPSGG